ncbi:MAG: VWA domain-containing protein, partial [Deltaproteobacteria bacterium]|nr:VWA domain-containing protein [Deltaproteobacteria bacterium]
FAAIKSNDKVGLIVFTDGVELFIPPKKGRSHVWHVISAILSFEPKGKGTGLKEALEFLTRVMRRKTVTFVISDFMAENYDLPLKLARFRHEIIGLMIRDPLERHFPEGCLVSVTDLETGSQVSVDMGSKARRTAFEKMRNQELEKKKRHFRSLDIDFLPLDAESDTIPPLLQFFRMREKRI